MSSDLHEGANEVLPSAAKRSEGAAVGTEPVPKRLGFRIILPVIRAAGLVPWAVVFAVGFVAAACTVAACEPGISSFGDSAWLMFEVVTTIGLGDFTCVTPLGRIAVAGLSVYSVFFLALITGAVVSYCQERMAARRNESVAHFIDQLEHLPELSHDELVELSEKVKRLDRPFSSHNNRTFR